MTVLKASRERTMMPVLLIALLAALFQVPKHELFRSKVKYIDELLQPLENEEDPQAEEDLPQVNQTAQEEQPYRKVHNMVNKTPLHTLHNDAWSRPICKRSQQEPSHSILQEGFLYELSDY